MPCRSTSVCVRVVLVAGCGGARGAQRDTTVISVSERETLVTADGLRACVCDVNLYELHGTEGGHAATRASKGLLYGRAGSKFRLSEISPSSSSMRNGLGTGIAC